MLLALLLAAAPAAEPVRYNTLVVYGNDPCPRSGGEEIVVCARLPEGERYRLPRSVRNRRRSEGPASIAWGRKVEVLEYVSRVGTPNSCSVVGSGGQTGCFQQFMRQARAERDAERAEQADVPR